MYLHDWSELKIYCLVNIHIELSASTLYKFWSKSSETVSQPVIAELLCWQHCSERNLTSIQLFVDCCYVNPLWIYICFCKSILLYPAILWWGSLKNKVLASSSLRASTYDETWVYGYDVTLSLSEEKKLSERRRCQWSWMSTLCWI